MTLHIDAKIGLYPVCLWCLCAVVHRLFLADCKIPSRALGSAARGFWARHPVGGLDGFLEVNLESGEDLR